MRLGEPPALSTPDNTIADRRRPGRRDVSKALLPVLRKPTQDPDGTESDNIGDGPRRARLLWLPLTLSVGFWYSVGVVMVKSLMRR